MRRLGTVLHLSGRGFLILRTDKTPPVGAKAVVLDRRANRVGTVADVFGPVGQPYVAVRPDNREDAAKLVGQMLYLMRGR